MDFNTVYVIVSLIIVLISLFIVLEKDTLAATPVPVRIRRKHQ